MSDEVVETAVIQVEADMRQYSKSMNAANKQAEQLGDTVAKGIERALVGGKSLEQVFKSLALDISRSFLNAGMAPLNTMISSSVASLSTGLLSSMSNAGTSSLSSLIGSLTPFANGGVVSSSTLFPMQTGMGMMGEAGAEAILPLRRGGDGKLGVAATNGAGQTVSVVMNVTTPDARSFSKSENQIATKLARAVGRGRRGL